MRVLLIEDDEVLANALKETLEGAGFTTDCVYDGEEGLTRVEMHNIDYDLLILDLGLPGKTGDLICEAIRKEGITIPTLILSGQDGPALKAKLLDLGADDYVTKPFSSEELLARVRALLRRPKESISEEVSMGDLKVNLNTHKVYNKNKEIPLTLKEFCILEYFMRNPNQIVKRDQILDHVWNFEFDSFSNVVDVHINNLRKKLRQAGLRDVLETVRGVGYRLSA